MSVSLARLVAGATTTLRWTASRATSCVASGAWSGDRASEGTELVAPTQSASYTLTCAGPGGARGAQVKVEVRSLALDCAGASGLRLHPLFTSHMVVQRDQSVPIWGCATPGDRISVTVAGARATGTASPEGRWAVQLPPLPAGGPHTLTATGASVQALDDVMVGDVWLCSGQSNMGHSVANSLDAAKEIADSAKSPNVRLFMVPAAAAAKPQSLFNGSETWRVAAPDSVGPFSGVCYFFGRDLNQRSGVAQGLIQASYGGTAIEFWMSAQSLESDPDFGAEVASIAANGPPAEGFYVTSLYNGMIAPLRTFPGRGVVWYQGEHNAGRAVQYRRLLGAMLEDWRRQLALAEGPFLIVQLPRYQTLQSQPSEGFGWAPIRESQLVGRREHARVGLVVTYDTGLATDIHPPDKQDVGARVALLARALALGEDLVGEAPLYREMAVVGGAIRVSFDNAAGGLMTGTKTPLNPVTEVAGPVEGFAIAGADQRFVFAEARIEGSTVIVSSPEVAAPVAVRYAWASNPRANLYSKRGLPVAPFRTDSW